MEPARPSGRPEMQLIALAAASDGTDLVVVDPTSPTEFAMPRPALWAIAQSLPWTPSYSDPEVLAESSTPPRLSRRLTPCNWPPATRMPAWPALSWRYCCRLDDGLGEAELAAVVGRNATALGPSTVLADRVDSLDVRLVAKGV